MDEYEKTVQSVVSRGKFGMKLGLENIRKLLGKLGNPQKDLKFIHIAGSNGKGSTVKMLEAVLTENDILAGAYTSPELIDFRERFRISGDWISKDDFLRLYKIVDKAAKTLSEYPTAFEIETAIALLYFREKGCELVLWETGLGGRLDATNVIDSPLISVITPISLEHTKYLGESLSQIAKEKAAIIKDSPAVIAPQQKEALDSILESAEGSLYITKTEWIEEISEREDRQDITVNGKTYPLGLFGSFQAINLLSVLKVLELLKDLGYGLEDEKTLKALKEVRFPGRFEVLRTDPLIILDGAHNPHGLKSLTQGLKKRYGDKKFDVYLSQIKEKDFKEGLKNLLPIIKNLYILNWEDKQAQKTSELIEIARKTGLNVREVDIKDLKPKDDTLITGSLYLLSELRPRILRFLEIDGDSLVG